LFFCGILSLFGVDVQWLGERFILEGKVATLVSPYFVDVAWQKLRQCILIF